MWDWCFVKLELPADQKGGGSRQTHLTLLQMCTRMAAATVMMKEGCENRNKQATSATQQSSYAHCQHLSHSQPVNSR